MRVEDVMTKAPACCTPDASLGAVARMMVERDCGAIPVVDNLVDRKPIGMITDRDIVTRALATGLDPVMATAQECMTTPAVTVAADARLHYCVELLEVARIRRAIVVDRSGGCIGIVSLADVAAHVSKREIGVLVREVCKPNVPAFVSQSRAS